MEDTMMHANTASSHNLNYQMSISYVKCIGLRK